MAEAVEVDRHRRSEEGEDRRQLRHHSGAWESCHLRADQSAGQHFLKEEKGATRP